jgi:hypothetical protein
MDFFKNISTKRVIALGVVASAVAAILIFSGVTSVDQAEAGAGHNVSGWAWSSNFGWISFSGLLSIADCADPVFQTHKKELYQALSVIQSLSPPRWPCGNDYGVHIDQGTGLMSGYAWYGWSESGSGGWISFNQSDLGSCPSGECKAVLSGNALTGWARAFSANDAQSGGWTGWIRLDPPFGGVTLNGNALEGYSWDADGDVIRNLANLPPDGDVKVPPVTDQFDGVGIGWIQWNPTCENGSPCGGVFVDGQAPTASLTANPTIISSGDSSNLTWLSTNATSCVGTNFSTGVGDPISGNTSVSPTFNTTYTVTCQNIFGTASDFASIAVPSPIANLVASPNEIAQGESTTLTWTSTDTQPDSCSVTGSGINLTGLPTNSGPGDEIIVSDLQTTSTFTLTCNVVPDGSITVIANVTVEVEEEIFHF